MGLMRVVRGTGNGSWFGNGRILGTHNPWGSDLAKARDPFINFRTLARLSFHSDPQVKEAVVANLLGRTSELSEEKDKVVLRFCDRALASVLIKENNSYTHLPYIKIVEKATPDELEKMSHHPSQYVRRGVAQRRETPKLALLRLIGETYREIALAAFDSAEDSLTSGELSAFIGSKVPELVLRLVAHPKIPRSVLIQFIIGNYRDSSRQQAVTRAYENLCQNKEITPDELDALGKGCLLFGGILANVVDHPRTKRETLLYIVLHSRDSVSRLDRRAFEKLNDITSEELDEIVKTAQMAQYLLPQIVFHPKTSEQTLRYIIGHIGEKGNGRLEALNKTREGRGMFSRHTYRPREEEVLEAENHFDNLTIRALLALRRFMSQGDFLDTVRTADLSIKRKNPLIIAIDPSVPIELAGKTIASLVRVTTLNLSQDIEIVLGLLGGHSAYRQQELLSQIALTNKLLAEALRESLDPSYRNTGVESARSMLFAQTHTSYSSYESSDSQDSAPSLSDKRLKSDYIV